MTVWICVACGSEFTPSDAPPPACPICLDARQYVPLSGQRWTTRDELLRDHRCRVEHVEPALLGVGIEPRFAIGQRALVRDGVVWDCTALLDDAAAEAIERAGGAHTIAISHPHYYTAMVSWAERLGARVLLHEADARHVQRPDARIEYWAGERHELGGGRVLHRLGGHFDGGTVLLDPALADGRGALLSGDIVQVVSDRDRVSFMYSYPNLIPLPGSEVERIRDVLETLEYDRVYGAWWETVVERDAKAKVRVSADRYVDALAGRMPSQTRATHVTP
jgi:hypothetical protein